MNLLVVVLGLVAGLWLFEVGGRSLGGAVLAAVIAFLLLRLQRLERRLQRLEGRAAPEPAPQPQPAAAAPVAPSAAPEPEFLVLDEVVFESETPPPAAASFTFHPQPDRPAPAAPPRPAPPPAPPRDEEAPGGFDLWSLLVTYFTGGNVVVRVGVVVLFFGVAFLLKYTAERDLVPIEFRLLGAAAAAIALLVCGWRLRQSRRVYALTLQGGGVGILYLTIFAALRLYQLLPAPGAFALLVTLSLLSGVLAILQEARFLAVFGAAGGFLAPVLTSSGGGNHVLLFSYYALLNAGILFTAWHRSWRELNLIGFGFTFGIGTLWGANHYRPELFATTEPFLLLFFLFYVAIAILFARNQPFAVKGYVDTTLVFGTPLVGFALQALLVRPYEYGLAWSALAAGGFYLVLATLLLRRGSAPLRTLVEVFLAMGVVFATLAVPLALDGRWTSAAWALEGAGILWVALRQGRAGARIFALVLQGLAGVALLTAWHGPVGEWPVLNGRCLGGLLMVAAALVSAFLLQRRRGSFPSAAGESLGLLVWGLLWWFGTGLQEIETFVPSRLEPATALGFCALSAAATFAAGVRLDWPALRQVYLGLLPVMTLVALYSLVGFGGLTHPVRYGGWLAWPVAFLVHQLLLYHDQEGPRASWLRFYHFGLLLLLVTLLTREAVWWAEHWVRGPGVWGLVVGALVPAAAIELLTRLRDRRVWPLSRYRRTYLYEGPAPLVILLWVGSLGVNLVSRGNPWPLPYLPLLNPLDLTQALVFAVLANWWLVLGRRLGVQPFGLPRRPLLALAGATLFLWLNAVLIRTLHHWGGVPFRAEALFASELVQTALSIFWALAALVVMVAAARRRLRVLWMVGAGLLAVVVVKLFTIDLAKVSTVERIVSFLVVGGLCLLIGYLAPLPEHAAGAGEKEGEA